jgi:hypothetical protein
MKRLVTGKLKEYTPNIFFNPLNEAVIFKKNTMIFMGSLFKKVDNIASKLKKLAEIEPNNRDLQAFDLRYLSLILKSMNREKVSLEIQELAHKLYPDDFKS